MFINPQTFFLTLFFTLGVYWSVPASKALWRAVVLIVFSALVIFLVSPLTICFVILTTAVTYWGAKSLHGSNRAIVFPVTLTLLAVIMFSPVWLSLFSTRLPVAGIVGISYFTIKSLGFIFDVYNGRDKPRSSVELLLLNAFFPSFSTGPIERARSFSFDKLTDAKLPVSEIV